MRSMDICIRAGYGSTHWEGSVDIIAVGPLSVHDPSPHGQYTLAEAAYFSGKARSFHRERVGMYRVRRSPPFPDLKTFQIVEAAA